MYLTSVILQTKMLFFCSGGIPCHQYPGTSRCETFFRCVIHISLVEQRASDPLVFVRRVTRATLLQSAQFSRSIFLSDTTVVVKWIRFSCVFRACYRWGWVVYITRYTWATQQTNQFQICPQYLIQTHYRNGLNKSVMWKLRLVCTSSLVLSQACRHSFFQRVVVRTTSSWVPLLHLGKTCRSLAQRFNSGFLLKTRRPGLVSANQKHGLTILTNSIGSDQPGRARACITQSKTWINDFEESDWLWKNGVFAPKICGNEWVPVCVWIRLFDYCNIILEMYISLHLTLSM